MNALRTQDYVALEDEYNARNFEPLDVVITPGEGVWVWDVEGRQYVDCLLANQSHGHPRIVQAMVEHRLSGRR